MVEISRMGSFDDIRSPLDSQNALKPVLKSG